MTAQAWEPRVSRLEGAFEQISDRLIGMDARLERIESKIDGVRDTLESKIDGVRDRLESKVDGNFKALIAWMLGQTVVVIGAVVTVAFALRH